MTRNLSTQRPASLARRGLLRLGAAFAGSCDASASAGAAVPASAKSRTVWATRLDSHPVYAHTFQHSVRKGEAIDVTLALSPGKDPVRARILFYRLGDYPWGRKLIWTSQLVPVGARYTPITAASTGTGWTPSLSVPTAEWPEGCYTADVAVEGAAEPLYNVVQAVVRPAAGAGDVLVKLSTNTWQAYNGWGGHSLYAVGDDDSLRGTIVSFDRPTPASLFEYEGFLVNWLEALAAREGFRVDYATNYDVHANPNLLDSYKLVICGSHDEYWSKEEFDAFERRVGLQGGNTIFFGANTGYWQVRYSDVDMAPGVSARGRQLVCYKSLDDPVARMQGSNDPLLWVTARFRDGGRRPETMLTGVGYQSWFPPGDGSLRYPYFVARTVPRFFEGTGLAVGDRLADVVGYEWDNCDPEGDGSRLFRPGVSRIQELPLAAVQVLFTGSPIDIAGRSGKAEAVYFRSASGAKVFSSGSIRWAWGLGKKDFESNAFQRFNANLVRDFLA